MARDSCVALFVCLFAPLSAFAQDGTWVAKPFVPTPIASHGTASIGATVYVVGGIDALTPVYSSDTFAYNVASETWSTKPGMNIPRAGLAVAAANARLYAIGGCGGAFCAFPTASTTNEMYDPVANTWTPVAPLPQPRVYMAAGEVDGFLYVISGSDGVTGLTNSNYRYDSAADTWSAVAPIPTPRYLSAAGVVNGILYVVGGSGAAVPWNIVEAYDPATDTWSTKAPMPTQRQGLAVAAVNGILYAIGGQTQAGINLSIVEAYDPATDSWTPVTQIPGVGRQGLGAAESGGRLYVTGGTSTVGILNSNEEFTPIGGPPPPTIDDLIGDIAALPLPGGTVQALSATLRAAGAAIDAGKTNAAKGQLGAFINHVKALARSGRLASDAANALIADAATMAAGL